jgi:hypothetical protein
LTRFLFLPAVVLVAFLTAPANAADDILAKLVPPRNGSNVCFKAEYDKAYLAAHPRQTSRSVLLSLQYETSEAGDGGRFVRLAVERLAPPAKLFMVGGCAFNETANLVQGKRLFPASRGDAGVSCGLFPGLGSDQKGGDILIQPSADERTAMLYLPGRLAAWRGSDQSREAVSVELGAADQVFRLRNVYPENCSSLAALRVK